MFSPNRLGDQPCDKCSVPVNPADDYSKISRIKFGMLLCQGCYILEKQALMERRTNREILSRRIMEKSAEEKVSRLVAVLEAVLDWPVEEIRPFAEQVYHLVNNPAPSAEVLEDLKKAERERELESRKIEEFREMKKALERVHLRPTTPRVV